jgi:phage terminase large subunit
VRADMPGTVLQTWERKVLGMPDDEADAPGGVHKHGGESAAFYQYPTNSRVWIAGLDRPGKVLSGELDVVVVNQAEELTVEDWGTLTTRTSGRAGVLRPGRLLADANPGPSTHWIKEQEREGTLRFVESRHRDNPDLYDQATGQMTEEGRRRLDALDKLPGVLRDRLYLGLWKSAEGTVYQPFAVENAPYAPINYFIGGVDWGWTSPGCLSVWGVDGDERMYRFCEWYETGIAVESKDPEQDTWIRRAQSLQERYNCTSWLCDPARPEYVAAFQSAGLPAIGADNAILQGIQFVEGRQRIAGDGLPRIVLLRGSRGPVDESLKKAHKPTCLEEEVEVYVYPKDPASGKPRKNENPVDANNHAADALRYCVLHLDGGGGFFFG